MSASETVCSNFSDSESLQVTAPIQLNLSDLIKNVKNSSTKIERWSKDATFFLIDQWQKNSSKFASTTVRNEELWNNIVKELEAAGFTKYTWKQAEDKWKNLRKGYVKVKDNKGDKSSGAVRVTCKFYDELDEIFRKSPSVELISIASSRNCNNFPVTDIESDSDDNLKHQPKKEKTKIERDTLLWLSAFKEDANAREIAREKRHQQTLSILSKAIDSSEFKCRS